MSEKIRQLSLLPALCIVLGIAQPAWSTSTTCDPYQPCPPAGETPSTCVQPSQDTAPACSYFHSQGYRMVHKAHEEFRQSAAIIEDE